MSTYREPLFDVEAISPLQNLSSVISKTNEIIDNINTLYAADIFEGDGICTTRTDGVVTVNVDPGPGIGIALTGEVTLNFDNVDSVASTNNTDTLFVGRNNLLRKVTAQNVLPPTVLGAHTFSGLISFSVNPSMMGFTNNIAQVVSEFSSNGSPKGLSVKTDIDSGLNLSPNALVRNYESQSSEAVFNYATTAFTTNPQNKIVVSYYTGLENTNQNVKIDSSSTLGWPTKWSWEYSSTQALLKVATQEDINNTAISYTHNSANPENSILNVTGKIFVSNINNSSQFISGPDGSSDRVILTNSDGLINSKFTNRIITTDIDPDGIVVGDLVVISIETDNNTYYGKAIASQTGNLNVIGIVESYFAGEATIVLSGEFELTAPMLDPGMTYVLSQTNAGKFVAIDAYDTGIIKPVFVAVTETKGILLNSTTAANTISSITLNNGTDNEEVLNIDKPNYPLSLVAGDNIQLSLTENDEIQIRVVDAAGAQNVFSNVALNYNNVLTAETPTDVLNFVSDSLNLSLDTDGTSIRLETTELFKYFTFNNLIGTSIVLSSNSTEGTLFFNAGDGIVFTQDGQTGVTISASISGGIGPNNINLGGPLRILVSDSSSNTRTLSVLGGTADDDEFDGSASGYVGIDLQLDPTKTITYNFTTGGYLYNGSVYEQHESYINPNYLPDELAGYMFGRVTPSPVGDGISNPDTKIRRLSRRDVRYFLGMATTGYIDSVDRLYSAWRRINSSGNQIGNTVEAITKLGIINFQEGVGITLEEGDIGGQPTLIINSSATPQNAFSSIIVDGEELEANTVADYFSLDSGNNILLSLGTNNSVNFNLNIPNEYTLLGNSGSTEPGNEIDLSDADYCVLGRAGSEIRPLVVDDFKWSFGSTEYTEPLYKMPFFGLMEVASSGNSFFFNAETSGRIKVMGSGGITVSGDGNPQDGWTLTISGNSGPGPIASLNAVLVNGTTHTLGTEFNILKFANGSGIVLNSVFNPTSKTVTITPSLSTISGNSIYANIRSSADVPSSLSVSENSVVGRTTGSLTNIPIKTDLRTALDIRHYSRIQYTNSGSSAVLLPALPSAAVSGATIKFSAGNNISYSVNADTLVISASTVLETDSNPTVKSLVPSRSGSVSIYDGTVLKFGNSTNNAITSQTNYSHLELFAVGQQTTPQYGIQKEKLIQVPNNPTLVNIISDLGTFNTQKYVLNSVQTETIYGSQYILNIKQYNAQGAISNAAYTLNANNVTVNSGSGNTTFTGSSVGSINFVNRKLNSTYTPNSGSTENATFVFASVAANTSTVIKTVSLSSASSVPDSSLTLHTNATGINFIVSPEGTSNLILSGSGVNQIFTSSGLVTFNHNIRFAANRQVDFTEATIVGLSLPITPHALTHQSTTSADNHAVLNTSNDRLFAWQVGAVDRRKPTLLNKIAITNTGDTGFSFDLSSVQNNILYGTSLASAITSAISNSNRGPLYLVLNTGEEANLGNFAGPPGQIIMIKKA